MFRRFATVLLIALALAMAGVYAWTVMAPLTVSIGSGPITLVQNGTMVVNLASSPTNAVTPILPVASTAGTALVALLAGNIGGLSYTAPGGWVKLATANDGQRFMDFWVYLNNPGAISAANFQGGAIFPSGPWFAQLSEWSNVASANAVDSSGTTTATSGTTLTPSTTASLVAAGDIAISAWRQTIAAPGAVTFTSPVGWTRLTDNGSDATQSAHLDAEYQLNPLTGSILAPILTSNTATNTLAAGVTVVLKAAPPIADHTAFLKYGSLGVKLNTADFTLTQGGYYLLEDGSGRYQLEDGSGDLLIDTAVPSLGDPVAITNPSWSGRVVSVTRKDISELITNYREVTVAATNTAVASATPVAPGNFSDVATGGYYLQEDGIGKLVLEDGSGDYLLEGSAFPYRNLFVTLSQNQDGTTTTYGTLETYETGFAAGQAVTLTSQNLGYVAQAFTITNVTQSWEGASATGQPTVLYFIEFGDAYQTLQLAGGGVLTRTASVATQQLGVAQPGGVLGYAAVTANQTPIVAAADLTGLSATVTVTAGRRINVTGYVSVASSVAGDILRVTIQEGATQLAQDERAATTTGTTPVCIPSAILTPTAGVHTYKLQGLRASGTGNMSLIASTTDVAYILVEDIGS